MLARINKILKIYLIVLAFNINFFILIPNVPFLYVNKMRVTSGLQFMQREKKIRYPW